MPTAKLTAITVLGVWAEGSLLAGTWPLAEKIAIAGAAITVLRTAWRALWGRVLDPLCEAIRNASRVYQLLGHLGLELTAIKERLRSGEDRFDRIEASLDAIARADRLRIKDALAGDERTPVDRRSSA